MKISVSVCCSIAVLSSGVSAKATTGTWQMHNTGWFDVAFSPNGGPLAPGPSIVCGVFNPAPYPGGTMADVQCMDGPGNQAPTGFPKATGRQAAHVAVMLGGIWVADTTGELWLGTPTQPLTSLALVAAANNSAPIIQWSDVGPLPGGCSCPSTSVYPPPPSCSGQLATDDHSVLFVLGCDGQIYVRKAATPLSAQQPFNDIIGNLLSESGITSIGYSRWHRQLFALGDTPGTLTTANWVSGQGWTGFDWNKTSATPPTKSGAALQNCNGNFDGNACWMAIGGAHAVVFNPLNDFLANGSPAKDIDQLLGFDEFQGTKTSPYPANANAFGSANGWNEFENTFLGSNYITSPSSPVIARVMEGGSGIVTAPGLTDAMWIVTNIGRLFSYEFPVPPAQVPWYGHPQSFFWGINIPQAGCPPRCIAPTINFLGVDTGGTMFARSYVNGSWTTPIFITSTGFAAPGAPVAAAMETNAVGGVFVVANDGALYEASTTNNGSWSAPSRRTPTGLLPAGAPLTTATVKGMVTVLAVDNSGALEAVWKDPLLGWLGPLALTLTKYAPPGAAVAAGTRSSGEVDIFSIATDGSLKYMAANAGVWSGPWTLSIATFAPPGAPVATAMDVHGFLNVFTIGKDGALYTKWDLTPLWSGPTALTATGLVPPGAAISAINFNNKSLNAFFVDNTGNIEGLSNAGLSWQGPTVIGADVASPGAPTGVAVEGSGQLDVFAVGTGLSASGVLESVNTGGGWSVPVELP